MCRAFVGVQAVSVVSVLKSEYCLLDLKKVVSIIPIRSNDITFVMSTHVYLICPSHMQ